MNNNGGTLFYNQVRCQAKIEAGRILPFPVQSGFRYFTNILFIIIHLIDYLRTENGHPIRRNYPASAVTRTPGFPNSDTLLEKQKRIYSIYESRLEFLLRNSLEESKAFARTVPEETDW